MGDIILCVIVIYVMRNKILSFILLFVSLKFVYFLICNFYFIKIKDICLLFYYWFFFYREVFEYFILFLLEFLIVCVFMFKYE